MATVARCSLALPLRATLTVQCLSVRRTVMLSGVEACHEQAITRCRFLHSTSLGMTRQQLSHRVTTPSLPLSELQRQKNPDPFLQIGVFLMRLSCGLRLPFDSSRKAGLAHGRSGQR